MVSVSISSVVSSCNFNMSLWHERMSHITCEALRMTSCCRTIKRSVCFRASLTLLRRFPDKNFFSFDLHGNEIFHVSRLSMQILCFDDQKAKYIKKREFHRLRMKLDLAFFIVQPEATKSTGALCEIGCKITAFFSNTQIFSCLFSFFASNL